MKTRTSNLAGVVIVMVLQVAAWRLAAAEYGPFTPRNKNGTATLKVTLQGAAPTLDSEFNAGNALVIKDAGSGAVADGPRVLQAKRRKSGEATQWYLKVKQDCVIVYKPGKETLTIKLWRELPTQVMLETRRGDYLIVDVSGGPDATNYPVSYQTNAPPLDDVPKTSKIVLRRIAAGTFVMGSPAGELGRVADETQHTVTLTQTFYIGIYEITQAQYWYVMGVNPSYFSQGAHGLRRPVEMVSWNMVRGGTWPGGAPDGASFMGKLRSKTGLNFDLPTEAQWEYACRAGSTNALNNNRDLQSTEQDPNMNIVGRYWYNGGSNSSDSVNGAHAPVGSYLPNQWGLYDMHGNVWEWCLDWYALYTGDATDPAGPASGTCRVLRGGGWYNSAYLCRSAKRDRTSPDYASSPIGFRVFLPAGQ